MCYFILLYYIIGLPQVGKIKVLPPNDALNDGNDGGTFALELNTRVYILKANDTHTAELWVNTLLRLKEQGLAATAQSTSAGPGSMNVSSGSSNGLAPPGGIKSEDKEWEKMDRGGGLCGCMK